MSKKRKLEAYLLHCLLRCLCIYSTRRTEEQFKLLSLLTNMMICPSLIIVLCLLPSWVTSCMWIFSDYGCNSRLQSSKKNRVHIFVNYSQCHSNYTTLWLTLLCRMGSRTFWIMVSTTSSRQYSLLDTVSTRRRFLFPAYSQWYSIILCLASFNLALDYDLLYIGCHKSHK